MHFVLQTPSLQHVAGVKIMAQLLWTQRDIFTPTKRLFFCDTREDTIDEKVKGKVSDLSLPEQLKKQLLNLIEPLRMEISHWCSYHCEGKVTYLFLDTVLPHQLCWTMHGTIDYAKTAELMVKNERLDMERRYEISCINCLEDEARQFLQSMGQERRQEYMKGVRNSRPFHYRDLIVFFTCTIIDDEPHLQKYFQTMMLRSGSSLNKSLFETMLCRGTRATCEYFFRQLTQREEEQVFNKCQKLIINRKYSFYSSNLVYYLSMMNEEQQEGVFRECSLLIYLLRWPLQSLFLKAAERGWQWMDNRARTEVLRAILFKVSYGCREYDYAQLFWEFWRLSSAEYKRLFFDGLENVDSLMQTKDEEFIKLLLNEAPPSLILPLCRRTNKNERVFMDEKAISDAALMECKQTAALNSSNDKENEEKRLKSQHLTTLVESVMEIRIKQIGIKRRRLV